MTAITSEGKSVYSCSEWRTLKGGMKHTPAHSCCMKWMRLSDCLFWKVRKIVWHSLPLFQFNLFPDSSKQAPFVPCIQAFVMLLHKRIQAFNLSLKSCFHIIIRFVSPQAWFTFIFMCVVCMGLIQTLLGRCATTVAALSIHCSASAPSKLWSQTEMLCGTKLNSAMCKAADEFFGVLPLSDRLVRHRQQTALL